MSIYPLYLYMIDSLFRHRSMQHMILFVEGVAHSGGVEWLKTERNQLMLEGESRCEYKKLF